MAELLVEDSSSATLTGISAAEKQFIRQGIIENCRTDGRRRHEFRKLQLGAGIVPTSLGSARVRNAECDVICAITADLVAPALSSPNEGKIYVSINFAAQTAADAVLSVLNDDSLALSRRLGRMLLSGPLHQSVVPRSELVVLEKRLVWRICIDIMIMTIGGALTDIVSYVVIAALRDARLPGVKVVLEESNVEEFGELCVATALDEDDLVAEADIGEPAASDSGLFDMSVVKLIKQVDFQVEPRPQQGTVFPCLDRIPIMLSMGQVEGFHVVDMTHEEHCSVDCILTTLINRNGEVTGLRKQGGLPLSLSVISQLLPKMRSLGKQLFETIEAACARSSEQDRPEFHLDFFRREGAND